MSPRWPYVAFATLRWPYVDLREPTLAYVGRCWPSLAFVTREPTLVDLREPSLVGRTLLLLLQLPLLVPVLPVLLCSLLLSRLVWC